MDTALLLIDLQQDFLSHPDLEPSAGEIVARTKVLLEGCRNLSLPVIHVLMTISATEDNRMPHWKRSNRILCQEGTLGHQVPLSLTPLPEKEFIITKTFYSGFENGDLEVLLKQLQIKKLLIAGVYLHGCIRQTVLDAYSKGYQIWVAEDATGSYDGLHGAITKRYLHSRAAYFAPVATILTSLTKSQAPNLTEVVTLPYGIADIPLVAAPSLRNFVHTSPRSLKENLWQVPHSDGEMVETLVQYSQTVQKDWQGFSLTQRQEILRNLANILEQEKTNLALQLAIEIGKPIIQAEAEVERSLSLLQTVAKYGQQPLVINQDAQSYYRYRPVGKIVLITPWNNPLSIPIGKIAPALLYGNTVIWKPALAGSGIAIKVRQLLDQSQCPKGVVSLILGDRSTAIDLMSHPLIDAVSLSGSSQAGYAAQEICNKRRIPLQGELGGNNGAIVWSDCDLEDVANQIVEGAFSFAGQRCTANRRVIVDANCYEEFLEHLIVAMNDLCWGDPLQRSTQVGPLISQAQCNRISQLVERAKAQASQIYNLPQFELTTEGTYYPPTLICCDDLTAEIVQQESFGPILVVQKAGNWQQALELNNNVKQGLVAALFSQSLERQQEFLEVTKAGVLKINCATANVGVDLPFGGWKSSGIGPPEHGLSNREFYTRPQAVYGDTCDAPYTHIRRV